MEKEIIEYLKKKYFAKAIILCGSRAVGDFDDNSDWDLFVFTDQLKKDQEGLSMQKRFGFPEIKGEDIDIYFLPLIKNFSYEIFGKKLRYSKVIFDSKEGLAKKIRKEALEFYKKGPTKWSKEKFILERNRSLRYLKKFDYLLKKKDRNQLFLRLSWYYADFILDWWFGKRREWSLRPQQAYSYIKKKDPNFYQQLIKISGETSFKTKVNAAKKLHKQLFGNKF